MPKLRIFTFIWRLLVTFSFGYCLYVASGFVFGLRAYIRTDMMLLFGGWQDGTIESGRLIISPFWTGAAYVIVFDRQTDVKPLYILNGHQYQAFPPFEDLNVSESVRMSRRYQAMKDDRITRCSDGEKLRQPNKTSCKVIFDLVPDCKKYIHPSEGLEAVEYNVGKDSGELYRGGTVVRNKSRSVYCIWSSNG